MNISNCDELSRRFVESYFLNKDQALIELEKKSKESNSNFLFKRNRLDVIFEQFEKQKESLIQFIKEIRFLTKKEQAKFIKIKYGTKNIKSKICFRLVDSQSLELENEENINLFIFIGKSIDLN